MPSIISQTLFQANPVAPVSYPNPVTAGNLLVMAYVQKQASAILPTDTLGTIYIQVASHILTVGGVGTCTYAVYIGIAPSSGANTVNLTGGSQVSWWIAEFPNVQAVVDTVNIVTSGSSSSVTGTLTTSFDGDLIIAVVGNLYDADVVAHFPYQLWEGSENGDSADNGGMAVTWFQAGYAGSINAVFDTDSFSYPFCILVALKLNGTYTQDEVKVTHMVLEVMHLPIPPPPLALNFSYKMSIQQPQKKYFQGCPQV